MRILLGHNSTYYPAHGGGDKSNRLLMEALAAHGHGCRVVTRRASFTEQEHAAFLRELAARKVNVSANERGVVRFKLNGVDVHTATTHANIRGYFDEQIALFEPDVIVLSTDDHAQLLLEAALRRPEARIVYLVRATIAAPFGPDAAFPSQIQAERLKRVDRVVGVSHYVANYMKQWGGIDAVHVPISLLDPGPYPRLGSFDNEFITFANPCAVKGISIFLGLADALPCLKFAAVPTWGTLDEEKAQMSKRPNVKLLPPVDRIDELFARTRVLLVPSLWAEARSRIVPEAMLRGIPVIASDVGGLPEAKMGVPYLLPVRQIERYQPRLDAQMVPVAEAPPQDIGPWRDALERLTSDRLHWDEIAEQSREAALRYAEQVTIEPFERLLEDVASSPRRGVLAKAAAAAPAPAMSDPLAQLSPERRALLALRLRQKATAADWLPALSWTPQNKIRLFCFPNAGAGTAAFRSWAERVPPEIALSPVRLPGRETRSHEAPFDRMTALVDALEAAIRTQLDQPYALFGHSLGAWIAFELARRLRDVPPRRLCVASARAPETRASWTPPPEPSDEELLLQARRLEGTSGDVLERPELRALLLPVLRADTSLQRNYIYTHAAPLPCPIDAFSGDADPNLAPVLMQGWARETASHFVLHTFKGGHFFLHQTLEFINVLSRALLQ